MEETTSLEKPTNPFGLKPVTKIAVESGGVETTAPTTPAGNPFGLKPSVESQVVAPEVVEKAVINDIPKYVSGVIESGNLQGLLSLDVSHWKQIDRSTLGAIRSALEDPKQKELADQLQGKIGAAELRLFSEGMKGQ